MNHLPSPTAEVQLTAELRLNTAAAVETQHSYSLVNISFINPFFETNSIFVTVISVNNRVQPRVCLLVMSGLLS